MIECDFQISPDWALFPFSQEDLAELKHYRINQIVRGKLTGTQRERSLQQNKWIHAVFRIVSQNTDGPDWDTPAKVKRNVKMAMKFFKDEVVVHNNKVFFELRSFAFDKMEQPEADLRYEEAKIICAKRIKVDPKDLEAEAKRSYGDTIQDNPQANRDGERQETCLEPRDQEVGEKRTG